MATLAGPSRNSLDNLKRVASNDQELERQHGVTIRRCQEEDGATTLSGLFFKAMVTYFISQAVDMVLASERISVMS